MKKITCAVLAAGLSTLVLSGQSRAFSPSEISDFKKPNMRVGQLQLHPYYTLAEEYDSNIYLTPRNVVGSWVTKNTLGLNLDLPVSSLQKFTGGYEFESQIYSRQSAGNSNIRQKADAQYEYKAAYGLAVTAADAYLNTTDPAFSELIQRQRRWQNTGSIALEYAPERNRFVGRLDAQETTHKYLEPALGAQLNRNETSFGAKGGYRIQPKTTAFTSYHHGIVHYSVPATQGQFEKSSHSENVDFGIEGDLFPKVTGRAMAGVTDRRYNQVLGNGARRTTNWTADADLVYKPLERSTLHLSLSRALQESASQTDRFYIANIAQLEARHELPYKLTAGLLLSAEIDKYVETFTSGNVTAVRLDYLSTQGVSLQYDIQEWLDVVASYKHHERDSRFGDLFNYEDHRTELAMTLKF